MLIAWVGSLALCVGMADGDFPKDVKSVALAATVRVEGGSGTIIERNGAVVYILTAAHVLGKRERVTVRVFACEATKTPDRIYPSVGVIGRADLEDLALLRLVTQDKLPDPLNVCPQEDVPRGKNVPVLALGCDKGVLSCYVDEVQQRDVVRRNKSSISVRFWESLTDPVSGRSGGALVDKDKRVLGVCSGGTGGRGYYTHTDEIHRFLQRYAVVLSLDRKEGTKK